eukprot:g164.t1
MAATHISPPMRDGWESFSDDDTGEKYYHHEETGAVCWDRPVKDLPDGWAAFEEAQLRSRQAQIWGTVVVCIEPGWRPQEERPRSTKVKHAISAVEKACAGQVQAGSSSAGTATDAGAEHAAVEAAEKLEAEAREMGSGGTVQAAELYEPPRDAAVLMRIDDRYSNYRGYIDNDGACYNNCVVDDMDELCGVVDLGTGYIKDRDYTTVAEVDKRGCCTGHSGSYLGQFSPFSYHELKLT